MPTSFSCAFLSHTFASLTFGTGRQIFRRGHCYAMITILIPNPFYPFVLHVYTRLPALHSCYALLPLTHNSTCEKGLSGGFSQSLFTIPPFDRLCLRICLLLPLPRHSSCSTHDSYSPLSYTRLNRLPISLDPEYLPPTTSVCITIWRPRMDQRHL